MGGWKNLKRRFYLKDSWKLMIPNFGLASRPLALKKYFQSLCSEVKLIHPKRSRNRPKSKYQEGYPSSKPTRVFLKSFNIAGKSEEEGMKNDATFSALCSGF